MKIKLLFILLFTLISCSEEVGEPELSNTYVITYFGNGNTEGSVPIDDNKYERNNVANVAINYGGLKRNGFSFIGWNTLFDGTGLEYLENESINIGNSDIELHAQWLDNVVYHELTSENQLKITGLPEIEENDWYYATVDFINGKLLLNQDYDDSNFQFLYKSGGDNYGFLRVSQGFLFNIAVEVDHDGTAIIKRLESETLVESDLFESYSTAEISGNFVNWNNLDNIFIPVRLTIDDNLHFGFLKVSFDDIEGILTIHSIVYNRVAKESILTY